MKKKLSSFITALMILFACVFASACGDKYKNLEFKVSYAFSADATTWYDGTNGISLNYKPGEDIGEGEKTSLVFNDKGEATVYIKVEVKNVKEKHLDFITLTSTSAVISSKSVKVGEVLAIPIKQDNNGDANRNTTLKLYENNSSKKCEVPFIVSRKLESIEFDSKVKPAVYTNSSLNLLKLEEHLTYNPKNKTNQLGVKYDVTSIGYYTSSNEYKETYNAEKAKDYVSIENGLLNVYGKFTSLEQAYIIKVKAISLFHTGEDGTEEISTEFDVYVVENRIDNPTLRFEDDGVEESISQINIYENGNHGEGKDYSKSTFFVKNQLENTIYSNDIYTADGTISYSTAIYVLDKDNKYKKYTEEYQSGINGLVVKDNLNGTFTVSIANRDVAENYIKVYQEIQGLDFSASTTKQDINSNLVGTKVKVVKGIVPKVLIVNDMLELDNLSDPQNAVVYGTTSENYMGAQLKLFANPTNNYMHEITLQNEDAGLVITNSKSEAVSTIANGSTIFVKFKDSEMEEQVLTIKTLNSPDYYNEKKVEDKSYITVTYKFTKVVTADNFAFVENDSIDAKDIENQLIDAEKTSYIYAKVYYTGVSLDPTTVTLKSDNDKIVFENGEKEIKLNEVGSIIGGNGWVRTETVGTQKCGLYRIPIKSLNSAITANISMVAGDGTLGVEQTLKVSSVFVVDEEDEKFVVKANSQNIKSFSEQGDSSYNFAISKGERGEFVVQYGNNETKAFTKLEIQTKNVEEEFVYENAISYNTISNSVFDVSGRVGGYTQVLDVKVSYYVIKENEIKLKTTTLTVQIAVYEPIGTISATASTNMIGYVNPYFSETSNAEITFNARTALGGAPASSVKFVDGEEQSNASQIKAVITNREQLKNARVFNIAFDVPGTTDDLSLLGGNVVLMQGETTYLSGSIKISMTGEVENIKEITLRLIALRFGDDSNVIANIVIKIAEVNKAEKILVSGENFVNKELRMSFIDVADGEYDETSFNVDLQFKDSASESSLKFDKISNALTHILYQYNLDENGKYTYTTNGDGEKVISKERISNYFFNIVYDNSGLVTIKANKDFGGGVFELILATKDSYKGSNISSVSENDFEKTYSILIRVSDGEIGSEYLIEKEEDLLLINYNLDKNFKLAANLGIDSPVNIKPLGLLGESEVSEFLGTFSGVMETPIGEDFVKTTSYSIKITVEEHAIHDNYGYLTGLFAIVGEGAKVENLKLYVQHNSEFNSTLANGLKISSVAGVNKGTINNVQVVHDKANGITIDKDCAGTIDFGGIVGLNETTGGIVESTADFSDLLTLNSNAKQQHNYGLIAGTNKGTISGSYVGKDSLNSFVFDVYANLRVVNTNTLNENFYYVGAVAGVNNGLVKGLLVGGQIVMASEDGGKENGFVGGLVGQSNESGNKIELSTAMALDIITTDANTNIKVGGIVGEANATTIDTVKFVSVQVERDGKTTTGIIEGLAEVGGIVANATSGIVANATNGSIKYASVESFIFEKIDENKKPDDEEYITPYYTLNGAIVGGLVSTISGTSVENSFVHANLNATTKVILTTDAGAEGTGDASETNTYFIGNVSKTANANNTDYSIVGGEIYVGANKSTINWSNIIEKDTSVSAATTDWSNIYVAIDLSKNKYQKVERFETDRDYYRFDVSAWTGILDGLSLSSSVWNYQENYNVVNINGVDFFFPYLIRSFVEDGETETEILMIVEPKDIKADINQKYVKNESSIHVDKFNFAEYEITESVIVNFFNGAGDEYNSHKLISDVDEDGISKNNGLLDATIIPEDAQGGLAFEIISGYNYAYLTDSKDIEIVFTNASGNEPILVRIYSVFNTELNIYVAFYSQSLFTDLLLVSNSTFEATSTDDYDYEMNLYTGQSNKIITLDAENKPEEDTESLNVFDIHSISRYLEIKKATQTGTKLDLTMSDNQIALKIRDDLTDAEKIPAGGESEIVTFKLILQSRYFGGKVSEDIPLGEIKLKVNMHNSASSISVDGADAEISTKDDINFEVDLTTDYIGGTIPPIENVSVNKSTGEISFVASDRDSIKIMLDVVEGEEFKQKLINNVNETIENNDDKINKFAELFNITIITSPLKVAGPTEKQIGYTFSVSLELIDEHVYRYIEGNIKFKIYIWASSNPEVNIDETPIEILMKPTTLSTARIESFVVDKLDVYTNYSNIVSNTDIETSMIEPGKLGNIMMIYLEPTYSKVLSATIKTKQELFVPSLGKNVVMKFTQLVHDKRKYSNGVFTTLYGSEGNIQQGDTFELELISRIDESGNRIYDGVICLYVQLEEFSGLEATITAELNVVSSNGKTITRTRDLLTSYLPGTDIIYDENKSINDGYMIQKSTSNNEMQIKVYGYQYNSNPTLNFEWNIDNASGFTFYNDGTGENKRIIIDGEEKEHAIADYISYTLLNDYNEVIYNEYDKSYTIKVKLNVSKDIPTAFKVTANMSLITKEGQLRSESDSIKFYPVDYILKSNSVYVDNVVNGRKNIAINQTKELELKFTTDDKTLDSSEEIYSRLLTYAESDLELTLKEKIASMFTYYQNGGIVNFADKNSAFEYNLVNSKSVSITGLEKFNNLIRFDVWFGYELQADGTYKLGFGEYETLTNQMPLSFTFTLNIYIVNEETEILVESADEIFDSATGTWDLIEGGHYVLLNDITIENVTPITTAIGSFDGNNRVISIKSFKIDPQTSDYGLFASIGTYTVEDQEMEQEYQKQTMLKNMIVDYSKFDGTIALNTLENKDIAFGGLVARNNGGTIYNCDVMNLNMSTDAQIDVVVSSDANITFGGLVAENKGIITNSRVGRSSYTKIIATPTTESKQNVNAGGLSFSIFNRENDNDSQNQFKVVAGAFVGSNQSKISSSYAQNTNLFNYSTNETLNQTAGFAGSNAGNIAYSYVKADDSTITASNPYSTGYVIENKGNGIVAGFVYSNSGEINNAYANVELETKSAYISGFVYNNTKTITESYAATSMNSGNDRDTNAEQPFIGVDSAGDLLSTGTIENSYYLMRSEIDTPYYQDDKDVAQGLNQENFQSNEYLVGFSFVLSNTKADREQGIWSYYTLNSEKRILPELITADIVAHSYRYVYDATATDKKLTNAMSYKPGSANNPHTISSVEEYNEVFTTNNLENKLVGYVRFINDIDFNNDETAIKTRANFTLGAEITSTKTSVEGNGMTISGIYLDVGEAVVEKIGLFAEIKNSYIKNLNLEFATPTTDGQFSTTTVMYSGGLAGTIENSAIINIKLKGTNTTLTGSNFVGGVAGLISGNSLVYGVETNLNVKASGKESYLYYNASDYNALNMKNITGIANHENYLQKLSYAGGVAGVLDLTKRTNIDYNVQFVDVLGEQMSAKTFESKKEANILAEYAGGVAGYASRETESFKLRYFTGVEETIRGNTAVGGLYGVGFGGITASQVTAREETQFTYDTNLGEYIINLETDPTAQLNKENTGNLNLLEGYKYVGGLIGIAVDATIKASYSKVGVVSGEIIGGLAGVSVASIMNYSYSIPYINNYDGMKKVGGLIGSAYGVSSTKAISRNSEVANYVDILKLKGVLNKNTDIQFTYSTVIVDNAELQKMNDVKLDYICADYLDADRYYLTSNANTNLIYVYAGVVNYTKSASDTDIVRNNTKTTSKSAVVNLSRLFDVGNPDQVVAYQEVFSGWSLMKYWTLDESKYFPLLNNKSVDNFVNIDDYTDFQQIAANPSGKYRVVQDITIPVQYSNWVVAGSGRNAFSGILIGEIEGSSRRPKIIIAGLNPNENNTSGFFQETLNATISNLDFEWTSSTSKPSISLENVDYLGMVSGLTCKDQNSLISNVEVRVIGGEGYILNKNASDNDKPIAGFGGIVGDSTNTNILGCNFVGKVDAIVKSSQVYVGGIVGKAQTNNEGSEEINSAVINNALFGASKESSSTEDPLRKYPISSINIEVAEGCGTVYVGGIIGYSATVAVASTSVGGIAYDDDYQTIDINVTLNDLNSYIYIGGVAGYATDGMISSSHALTNITVVGTIDEDTAGNLIAVGGLAGFGGSSVLISDCEIRSNIKTKTATEILRTQSKTQVILSTGVAILDSAKVERCLFQGEVNTEGADIDVLYAGGAVAQVNGSLTSTISEIVSYSTLIVGTTEVEGETNSGTNKLYVGGLVGTASNVAITYSTSWGRIVPITNSTAQEIYAGGLIGQIQTTAKVNNSYTISSIIADSIAGSALEKLNMSALVGAIPEGASPQNITFRNVFYSSDYGLFADENYLSDGSSIGINLSAETMLNDKEVENWQKDLRTEINPKTGVPEENSIWANFTVKDAAGATEARLPYPTSLEETLIDFDILAGVTGKTTVDYKNGSEMRPQQLSSGDFSYTFASTFTYYLLVETSNKATPETSNKTTPKFSGTLNGVLIGQDLSYENTFTVGEINGVDVEAEGTYHAIIPAIGRHSAVSNLNVVMPAGTYPDEKVVINNLGIIAGYNAGVIFNSSVQGNGLTINASNLGLIACKNVGLISYCYSTAEIISTTATVGGIVQMNNGKLLSNYFTGYINSSSAAGVVHTSGDNNFAYNNYMAGVITDISENAFSGGNFKGANKLVDMYSDYNYYLTKSDNEVLKPVSTASLMAGEGLTGEWYKTVVGGTFSGDKDTFGTNYNYPVYRFNKQQAHGGSYIVDDTKNQLYTGTGGQNEQSVGYKLGAEEGSINSTVSTQYSKVVGNTEGKGVKTANNEYVHAFKIPHLGVLASVNALLNNQQYLNYVIIYDINGCYDGTTYIPWKAVGNVEDAEHGFNLNSNDQDIFNGVLATNKYYAYNSEEGSASYCEIKNLSGEGLIANIGETYFGSIKLGSFHDMKKSGPLGNNIKDGKTAYVNNVEYLANSVVSGATLATGQTGTNYYGGLFGLIEEKATLQINNFITGSTGTGASPYVRLKSDNATTGLIAGQSAGTITMLSEIELFAWFDGNAYAGGLVGEITGGIINGNNSTVNISKTNLSGNGSNVDGKCVGMIGGVVGLSNTASSTIKSVKVNLQYSGSDALEIKTNGFGGIVGEANAEIAIDGCIISADAKEITFIGNQEEDRYYGLVAGLQNATIEVTGTPLAIEIIRNIIVQTEIGVEADYNENTLTTGVGLFVGKQQNSDLKIKYTIDIDSTKETDKLMLISHSIPNVGGLVGYFNGTGNSIQIQEVLAEGENRKLKADIIGSINVGGYVGYMKGDIKTDIFKETNLNGLFTVKVNGSSDEKKMNFGGLFGIWSGSNFIQGVEDENGKIIYKESYAKLENINSIVCIEEAIGTIIRADQIGGFAYNVGGIAGKLVCETINVGNLFNSALIGGTDQFVTQSKITSGKEDLEAVKLVNVGGIFGLVNSGTGEIVQTLNLAQVNGYQNVGGLVGYATNAVTVKNPVSVELEVSLNLKLDDAGEKVEGGTITQLNPPDGDTNTYSLNATVFGVINVGGVMGYAGEGVTISEIHSRANVYGNASVGGIVGLANKATIKNNYQDIVSETKDGETIINNGLVKGIYYNLFVNNEENYDFIPTSVGGVVGTAVETELQNNIIDGVLITSSLEGSTTSDAVISTVRNNMVDITIGEGNNVLNYADAESGYELTKHQTVDYAEVEAGFGGFVGTLDGKTIGKGIENNYIKNIQVNAQLGMNVGTYYGVYKFNGAINDDEKDANIVMKMPYAYGTINIDGAYNVGGVAGYVAGNVSTAEFNISNGTLTGLATIQLQTQFVGFYVGGLFGKTTTNEIRGLQLVNYDGKTNIRICADNCQYAGGLIGRAEVSTIDATDSATIQGFFGYSTDPEVNLTTREVTYDYLGGDDILIDANGNTVEMTMISDNEYTTENETFEVNDNPGNFGGIIGILKVGKPASKSGVYVTVEGYHNKAFTVNTIENINYGDGDSEFSVNESEGLMLEAEAMYVNLDSFNITATKEEKYYNANAVNPVNGSKGWAKDYTAFRRIQRIIPQEDNNGAKWDSVVALYDANNVTHVGTIENLGLWTDKNNDGINDTTFRVKSIPEEDEEYVERNEPLPREHICFTIYAQSDLQHTLYSSIGIASLYFNPEYDDENENISMYGKPKDNEAKWWQWALGAVLTGTPPETYYLDLYGKGGSGYNGVWDEGESYTEVYEDGKYTPADVFVDANGDGVWNAGEVLITDHNGNGTFDPAEDFEDTETPYAPALRSLSYFDWGTIYQTMSGDKKNYQNGAEEEIFACYFVEDYLAGDAKHGSGTNEKTGAYFVFDIVYENATLNEKTYNAVQPKWWKPWTWGPEQIELGARTDTYLPKDGSMFSVIGISSPLVNEYKSNVKATDWFEIISEVATLVIDIIIIIYTTGTWGAIKESLKTGLKAAGKGVVKLAVGAVKTVGRLFTKAGRKYLKRVMRIAIKKLGKKVLVGMVAVALMNYLSSYLLASLSSYSNFTQASEVSYGFLSTTYSKDLFYKADEEGNVSLDPSSDYAYTADNGDIYLFHSHSRPTDYHINKYIGVEVSAVNHSVIDKSKNLSTILDEKTYNTDG
ncbi:MAG: hypothetical protein J6Q13_03975, partial [Clostridia bacterium]|nr:hypothetical protein [Clostridia bacterium]